MAIIRIQSLTPLENYRLRLILTDGSVIERDVMPLMNGPLFTPILIDPSLFRAVSVEGDIVVWPNGAEMTHEVLIGRGVPPSAS